MNITKERTILYGFIFAAIFLIVSYIAVSNDALQHEAYRHAAEASYGEVPKPEGHVR